MGVLKNIANKGLVITLSLGTTSALLTTTAIMAVSMIGVQNTHAATHETINSIEIFGNERIERETILAHMSLREGSTPTQQALDKALKRLFDSGLFMDAHLSIKNSVLIVSVEENPIVNQVALEGNDDISEETLKGELSLKPRQVYTLSRVKADTQRLQDIYRPKGHFAATVTPKIIKKEQNRVDVVFEIQEGEKTAVQNIFFVGNKHFGGSRLGSVIQTRETRWYRFFSNDDSYDPDRVSYDRELLRKFYLEHGYADFVVRSAVAELTPDKKDFYITYTLFEGDRYQFGKIDISCILPNIDTQTFKQYLTMKEGDWYSTKEVEKTTTKITDALGNRGYAFVDVRPKPEKDEKGRIITLTFEILEGPKVYIDRVTIAGNDRTDEAVIRRELRFHEGDAFNTNNLKMSEANLKNLGFFKKVTVRQDPSSSPDKVNIEIEVEEEPTGELSLGGGFSTSDGPLANMSFSERNFRGKGQALSAGVTWAKKRQEFDISFTEPYFLGRNLSAGFDLYRITQKKYHEASFDQNIYGTRLRTGYRLSDEWSQGWSYTIQREEINNIESNASRFVQEQKGKSMLSAVGHQITYDRRDNRIDPTEGYYVGMTNDYAGVGGNIKYFRNKLLAGWYYPVADQVVLGIKGSYGYIQPVGQKIRIVDRFTLGGETLRGFEVSGIGPRDIATNDALGGRQMASGTAEMIFLVGWPSEYDVKGAVFSDIGSVWSCGDTASQVFDTSKLRASVGVGIRWKSPMGPISVDLAVPFSKGTRDKTQPILFGFSTRF